MTAKWHWRIYSGNAYEQGKMQEVWFSNAIVSHFIYLAHLMWNFYLRYGKTKSDTKETTHFLKCEKNED